MSIGIVLDPGHVKDYNTGAIKSYKEGTRMFELAYMLKEELEKYDLFEVWVTRNKVTDNPSLTNRGKMAKTKNAKIFISLHSNAVSKGTAWGNVIFISIKRPTSKSLGDKLGAAITELISADVPSNYYRGTQTNVNSSGNDYYGVIRNSIYDGLEHSFLIEHAFHSTVDECVWLNNSDNLRKIAITEAKVLADHYGAKLITTEESNDTYVEYVVNKGDTLSGIAMRFYGEANRYPEIMEYNKMKDTKIFPNQIIKVKVDEDNKDTVKYTIDYTVKHGDTLWDIAEKYLGDGSKYKNILKYNNLPEGTVIHSGDKLLIPCDFKKYKVVKGDSWYKIAKEQMNDASRYKELAAFNHKSPEDYIYPDDIINIPE